MAVYAACKPLTTLELGSALYMLENHRDQWSDMYSPPDEAQLRSLWPDFLILDSTWNSGGVWRFTHSSLPPAFFTQNTISAFGPESGGLTSHAHRQMAECCLRLLLQARYGHDDAPESSPDYVFGPMHPLQIYARNYWIAHLQALEGWSRSIDENDLPQLPELLTRFLGTPTQSSKHFIEWYHQALRDGPLGLRPESRNSRLDQASLEFVAPATNPVFALVRFSLLGPLREWKKGPGIDLLITNKSNQTLLEVVADGKPESIAIARQLVDLGADVNQPQKNEHGSALTHAVALGNLEWLHFLISRGADANANTGGLRFGSPLAAAAYYGNKEIIKMLIQAGADVNLPLTHGQFTNALAAAAHARKADILQFLIDSEADVNIRDDRYNALVDVVATGSISCVQVLIDGGADVRRTGFFGPKRKGSEGTYPNALFAAASEGHDLCLRALLDAGALGPLEEEPISYSGHALAQAASRGHVECVHILLEAGVDLHQHLSKNEWCEFSTALQAAVSEDQLSCLILLLSFGANVDDVFGETTQSQGGTALGEAARRGHIDCVRALIDRGADVESPQAKMGSPLAAAAHGMKLDCVQALIGAGAKVNRPLDTQHGSALATGAAAGTSACLRLLIAAGADVNLPLSGDFGSALAAAAACGKTEALDTLIEAGADASQSLLLGYFGSALAAAAWSGNLSCAGELVRAGADVNQQPKADSKTKFGSPLAAAAYMGHAQMVRFLVKKGADVNSVAEHGEITSVRQGLESGQLDSWDWQVAQCTVGDRLSWLSAMGRESGKKKVAKFLEGSNLEVLDAYGSPRSA
jgi:ankyrin repeat protein